MSSVTTNKYNLEIRMKEQTGHQIWRYTHS